MVTLYFVDGTDAGIPNGTNVRPVAEDDKFVEVIGDAGRIVLTDISHLKYAVIG